MATQGCVFALAGQAPDAVPLIVSSIAAYRSTGSAHWMPFCLSILAKAYAQHDRFDDAWRCIYEAMAVVEATRERWNEANVYRIAGEIALMLSDAAKAEAYFGRALEIARAQQARSWELRAATNLARLWRDQDK
jgi:hypothetical protein